jgi:hypothetical protein
MGSSFNQRGVKFRSSSGKSANSSLKRLSLWLVVLIIILAIVFYLLEAKTTWDSSVLTLVLNIVFVVIPSFFIALIASWGFMHSGSWQVMWLGVGTLAYGLAVLLSMWIRKWASTNAYATVFAIVYLLAGLFFFVGAVFPFNRLNRVIGFELE